MARFVDRLRRRAETIVECRRCGTTVGVAEDTCPTCGGSGFATYVIST